MAHNYKVDWDHEHIGVSVWEEQEGVCESMFWTDIEGVDDMIEAIMQFKRRHKVGIPVGFVYGWPKSE